MLSSPTNEPGSSARSTDRILGLPARELRWIKEAAGGSQSLIDEMVRRREAGEPLQYVLGRWDFRGVSVAVDQRVLIPRPETEQVVSVALSTVPSPSIVVDLGTGSGAIALALSRELSGASIWATDVSPAALDVARLNLSGAGVRLCSGSWWAALPESLRGSVDLAISNPPYVSVGEMASLDSVVADWEPESALVSGPSGLECIEELLGGGLPWLVPGGALVIEIAPHQAPAASRLAVGCGYDDVAVHPDLAGRDRALVARAPR